VCKNGECVFDEFTNMGYWCESDEDCGNDDLVCTDDNMCLGNECTETYDETTGYTSTGCTG